jgi:glutamine amidotransferase
MARIAVIDYRLSNLFSVLRAAQCVGLNAFVTSDRHDVVRADAVILPGVGAFAQAMSQLRELGLDRALIEVINDGRPLFGICLGMQLLFTKSSEFGETPGLDIVSGTIRRFPTSDGSIYKVPQIGWNKLRLVQATQSSPLQEVSADDYMYFVHSYYAVPNRLQDALTHTVYGATDYCSSLWVDNHIFATQFHPEKSGAAGVNVYRTWGRLSNLVN